MTIKPPCGSSLPPARGSDNELPRGSAQPCAACSEYCEKVVSTPLILCAQTPASRERVVGAAGPDERYNTYEEGHPVLERISHLGALLGNWNDRKFAMPHDRPRGPWQAVDRIASTLYTLPDRRRRHD